MLVPSFGNYCPSPVEKPYQKKTKFTPTNTPPLISPGGKLDVVFNRAYYGGDGGIAGAVDSLDNKKNVIKERLKYFLSETLLVEPDKDLMACIDMLQNHPSENFVKIKKFLKNLSNDPKKYLGRGWDGLNESLPLEEFTKYGSFDEINPNQLDKITSFLLSLAYEQKGVLHQLLGHLKEVLHSAPDLLREVKEGLKNLKKSTDTEDLKRSLNALLQSPISPSAKYYLTSILTSVESKDLSQLIASQDGIQRDFNRLIEEHQGTLTRDLSHLVETITQKFNCTILKDTLKGAPLPLKRLFLDLCHSPLNVEKLIKDYLILHDGKDDQGTVQFLQGIKVFDDKTRLDFFQLIQSMQSPLKNDLDNSTSELFLKIEKCLETILLKTFKTSSPELQKLRKAINDENYEEIKKSWPLFKSKEEVRLRDILKDDYSQIESFSNGLEEDVCFTDDITSILDRFEEETQGIINNALKQIVGGLINQVNRGVNELIGGEPEELSRLIASLKELRSNSDTKKTRELLETFKKKHPAIYRQKEHSLTLLSGILKHPHIREIDHGSLKRMIEILQEVARDKRSAFVKNIASLVDNSLIGPFRNYIHNELPDDLCKDAPQSLKDLLQLAIKTAKNPSKYKSALLSSLNKIPETYFQNSEEARQRIEEVYSALESEDEDIIQPLSVFIPWIEAEIMSQQQIVPRVIGSAEKVLSPVLKAFENVNEGVDLIKQQFSSKKSEKEGGLVGWVGKAIKDQISSVIQEVPNLGAKVFFQGWSSLILSLLTKKIEKMDKSLTDEYGEASGILTTITGILKEYEGKKETSDWAEAFNRVIEEVNQHHFIFQGIEIPILGHTPSEDTKDTVTSIGIKNSEKLQRIIKREVTGFQDPVDQITDINARLDARRERTDEAKETFIDIHVNLFVFKFLWESLAKQVGSRSFYASLLTIDNGIVSANYEELFNHMDDAEVSSLKIAFAKVMSLILPAIFRTFFARGVDNSIGFIRDHLKRQDQSNRNTIRQDNPHKNKLYDEVIRHTTGALQGINSAFETWANDPHVVNARQDYLRKILLDTSDYNRDDSLNKVYSKNELHHRFGEALIDRLVDRIFTFSDIFLDLADGIEEWSDFDEEASLGELSGKLVVWSATRPLNWVLLPLLYGAAFSFEWTLNKIISSLLKMFSATDFTKTLNQLVIGSLRDNNQYASTPSRLILEQLKTVSAKLREDRQGTPVDAETIYQFESYFRKDNLAELIKITIQSVDNYECLTQKDWKNKELSFTAKAKQIAENLFIDPFTTTVSKVIALFHKTCINEEFVEKQLFNTFKSLNSLTMRQLSPEQERELLKTQQALESGVHEELEKILKILIEKTMKDIFNSPGEYQETAQVKFNEDLKVLMNNLVPRLKQLFQNQNRLDLQTQLLNKIASAKAIGEEMDAFNQGLSKKHVDEVKDNHRLTKRTKGALTQTTQSVLKEVGNFSDQLVKLHNDLCDLRKDIVFHQTIGQIHEMLGNIKDTLLQNQPHQLLHYTQNLGDLIRLLNEDNPSNQAAENFPPILELANRANSELKKYNALSFALESFIQACHNEQPQKMRMWDKFQQRSHIKTSQISITRNALLASLPEEEKTEVVNAMDEFSKNTDQAKEQALREIFTQIMNREKENYKLIEEGLSESLNNNQEYIRELCLELENTIDLSKANIDASTDGLTVKLDEIHQKTESFENPQYTKFNLIDPAFYIDPLRNMILDILLKKADTFFKMMTDPDMFQYIFLNRNLFIPAVQ